MSILSRIGASNDQINTINEYSIERCRAIVLVMGHALRNTVVNMIAQINMVCASANVLMRMIVMRMIVMSTDTYQTITVNYMSAITLSYAALSILNGI